MRLLYDLFFLVFSVLYFPYLLVKGKAHRDFLQKFGFLPKSVTSLTGSVWIHAVSVGEAVLAAKLSAGLKKRFPDVPVIVSTTTQTGNDMIHKSGKGILDAVFYYPLDMSHIVSRVVKLLRPRLYVMIETELWPNLLEELHSRSVPVVLVNGRISDASFTNYRKIGFVTRRILGCIGCFCMQSERDAVKIKRLGAPAEKVFVTGNMKFDEGETPAGTSGLSREYLGFGKDDKIIVAGSTHFPEERSIIDVYKNLKREQGDLRLILAPRHVERVDAVRTYVERSGLSYNYFSDILGKDKAPPAGCDILLVDTIGHLKDLYGIATVVFIGGSLVRKGGQNPIEAARWGKAVVFGPHMSNFREVADVFLENEAAVRVKDVPQFERELKKLLSDPGRKDRMARSAREVIERNSGAIGRTVEKIEQYI